MRYALIIAGGSGTRLWPMSTKEQPKQLIPFMDGRSLLQIAIERLEGLLPAEQIYVCAGEALKQIMLDRLPGFSEDRFIGEPTGRDTLNAVGLGTGVLGRNDEDATVAVFTADHIIEPVDSFRGIVERGFRLAEARPSTLVTFGIAPTQPATGYGYLQLGSPLDVPEVHNDLIPPYTVEQFKEKPDLNTARGYFTAGARRYLWNSGMFVWRASTMMQCIERFAPKNHAGLKQVVDAWDTPERDAVREKIYPTLDKISVDYAVMEPASQDEQVQVAAVPMPLRWLDVGSWPSFAETRDADELGNATSGCKAVLMDSNGTLVASDQPEHLIATIGCDDMIVIHTAKATLVCKKNQAQQIKNLHAKIGEDLGDAYL